jgi:hypothetical protein
MIEVDKEVKQELRRRGLREAVKTVIEVLPERLLEEKVDSFTHKQCDVEFEMSKIGLIQPGRGPRHWGDDSWAEFKKGEKAFEKGYDDGTSVIESFLEQNRGSVEPGEIQKELSRNLSDINGPEALQKTLKNFED